MHLCWVCGLIARGATNTPRRNAGVGVFERMYMYMCMCVWCGVSMREVQQAFHNSMRGCVSVSVSMSMSVPVSVCVSMSVSVSVCWFVCVMCRCVGYENIRKVCLWVYGVYIFM